MMSTHGYAPYVLVNGRLRLAAHARVSIFDRGFLYGEGLFETVPVYDGQPFLLKAHLARLYAGAHALGFRAPLDHMPWDIWVQSLLAANTMTQGVLRIQVTQGMAPQPGLRKPPSAAPTVLLTAAPPRAHPIPQGQMGLTLQRSTVIHPSVTMLPTSYKHSNYLVSVLAWQQAIQAGADEALLLNQDGRVCEAAMHNIMAVVASVLVTPSLDEGPLAGVTRAAVLALARRQGWAVQERPLTLPELCCAEEVFLTSALNGVIPVQTIQAAPGDHCLAQWPTPGLYTTTLIRQYWTQVRQEAGAPWWPVDGLPGD